MIEYDNHSFNSEIEARWAVYFKTAGITYEYISERDENVVNKLYTQFWLPQVRMFAAIKEKVFTQKDINRLKEINENSGYPCLLLIGFPDFCSYFATDGFDYILTNFHNYVLDEKRFYCCTEYDSNSHFPLPNKIPTEIERNNYDLIKPVTEATLLKL
ncbi:hypothetical protein [Methanolacinia paynteri]|uniref:hypothetical protein n=1 Tax=Methanolacinia paynteri TaxID=230356 RepID=UPI00064EB58E|nr:hypothetical protein [Methanolacinia paynteri]